MITEENFTFKFDETAVRLSDRMILIIISLIVSKNFNTCWSMEGLSMNFTHSKNFCIHACTSSLKPAQVYFFDPT